MSQTTKMTVVDPYDANHPDNRLSHQTPNPMALARKSEVGQLVLADDSPFMQMAAAAGLNPAAMALELASVVARKPAILKCTRESMIAFMLDAAKLRLPIGRGVYPVPIKGRLEAWVGYKGAKELALRSGSIRDCWATVVFEGDVFEEAQAPIPVVTRHVFGPNKGNMEKAIKVYATLLYPGGRTRMVIFEREKIEWYRNKNRSWRDADSPWQTAPEEMWKAKAILHAVGDLPHNSPELAHLAAMIESEEQPQPARLPGGAEGQPTTDLPGPNTDEGPEELAMFADAPSEDDDQPADMSLGVALAVPVKTRDGRTRTMGEHRNSGLERLLEWSRGKLETDPESVPMLRIANAAARVLRARAAGECQEPPRAAEVA